ncbi:hypothetical protein B2G69_07565 [Methylorubrum zatmanii]|nr:hypothetical protein B2G69_07565 [Methylorubrum zatmanii]
MTSRERGLSSAHFLKLIEDQGNVGFWSADLARQSISSTVGFNRLLGVASDTTLTFASLVKIMHPDDQATHGAWPDALRHGQAIDNEYRIVRPDGIVRWVRNKAEVVLDQDAKPFRALGVLTDVTNRHEARHLAQMGYERYQALVRAIAVIVWTAAADGSTREGSDWMRLTGQSGDEMTGHGWLNAVHPDDRARTREAWRMAVAHQNVYDTDYRVLGADGTYRWFNARGAPILNQDGSIREWVGVCLSITGSKRFQPDGTSTAGPAQQLTAGQVRAARALLGWSADELAANCDVSASTIARIEDERRSASVRSSNLLAVRQAFEEQGIEFAQLADGGISVQLDRRMP